MLGQTGCQHSGPAGGRPCQLLIRAPGETGSLPRGLNGTPVRAVGSRLVPGRFETDFLIPEQIPERQGQGGLCPHTRLQTHPFQACERLERLQESKLKEHAVSSWPHAVWPLTRYAPPNLQMQPVSNKPRAVLVILHDTRTREGTALPQRWVSEHHSAPSLSQDPESRRGLSRRSSG